MSLIPDKTCCDDRPRIERPTYEVSFKGVGHGATNGATKCLNGAKKV